MDQSSKQSRIDEIKNQELLTAVKGYFARNPNMYQQLLSMDESDLKNRSNGSPLYEIFTYVRDENRQRDVETGRDFSPFGEELFAKEPKITINKTTYGVRGKTAAEATENANKVATTRHRYGLTGETTVKYEYQITSSTHSASRKAQGGGFEIDVKSGGADVTTIITIDVPKWENINDASQQEQQAWNNSMKKLEEHEDLHVQIGVEGAKEIQSTLENYSVIGKGKTPEEALKNGEKKLGEEAYKKVGEINDAVRKRQDKLDEATYGRKKGVSPPAKEKSR